MRPEVLFPLFQPVTTITGVGPRIAGLIGRVAGPRKLDLCLKLPTGLVDRRFAPSVAEAPDGRIATFTLLVEEHQAPPHRSRLPYKVRCRDETGTIDLVFFNARADYLASALPVGEKRVVSGRVERYRATLQMIHPDVIERPERWTLTMAVEPVYPSTQGLGPRIYRRAVSYTLNEVPDLPEWQSASVLVREAWPGWRQALLAAHCPEDAGGVLAAHPARRRLAYDELLAGQLAMALVRHHQRRGTARPYRLGGPAYEAVETNLPFALTGAQRRTLAEIGGDLASGKRMMRLLQGDVGSGKTVVAALAAAAAHDAGGQAAIMAPTEILAQQHFETLSAILAPAGLEVGLLTGRSRAGPRRTTLVALASGALPAVVGTHALFQERIAFADLRLAVIDEQHRFGVEQRLALTDKGQDVHTLAMTATPIPRTLLMTTYGDLDTSRLDEKPPGRKSIETRVLRMEQLDRIVERIRAAAADGRRAYWVCPLVEESDKTDAAAAEARFVTLQPIFGDRMALIHGRMTADSKARAMAAFAEGTASLLVATTVIEVGVDVPAADIMVIEQAERFGLAQLHQLRGRIGRGGQTGACVLLYGAPLSQAAEKRLRLLRECDDGFRIAEADLELRGAGELLGTRQSGLPAFRVADLDEHGDMLRMARDEARLIVNRDPDLSGPRGTALRVLLYLFERDAGVRLLRSG
ncbi:MAG: ATP-dependent DNA helicase RecG [Alphaproteobacteria bacterium]|nr:ATP-dependent DNA helicase RecG [Alphaproteobacteria bacterium]MCY4318268.1 ATP-dependent DNA helicase RecG [Alphaproteobacteria bacterium]